MGSVNIAIKDEAYRFLQSLKSVDKSFSDVILEFKTRQKNEGKDLLRFFGVLKSVDWKSNEGKMKDFRKEFEERFE